MQENLNIPDSTIQVELTFRNLCLMHMQQLTNFPYIEQDFDALTDYELLCLVVKYLNDVIDNSNEQNTSITNLYNAFLQLQTYMNNSVQELEDAWNDKTDELEEAWTDKTTELETAFNNLQTWINNYFDNLDVQEEINNKLDQMLEDGVLEQIIEQFIQSTALWCFDTVNDMKQATNLIDGSYAKTLGYYSVNDGGGANYKITNTQSSDDYQEELESDLYATLIINDSVHLKQLGAKGNGTDDDLIPLTIALSKYNKIIFDNGTYNITDNIIINNKIIEGNGATINTISQTTSREHQIIVKGKTIIKDLIFKQSNHGVSLCGLFDNDKTTFENCEFIVDNVATNGYVDLYSNNKNVTFNNCKFNIDSYNSENTLTIGGIWIRENTANTITENIFINNCVINHNSIDECLAVWDWYGSVRNVYIDNCTFNAKDTCTSPHFISLNADKCILSNSIIYGPSASSNSILKGDFYNQVNNCIIYSHKQENNGISSGNIIFNNCKIYNDNSACYLSVNKNNIFKNCEIEVNAITDTRNIELYNCKITTTSTTSSAVKCFIKNAIMKNCILNIKTCQTLFETYYSDPFDLDIENCKIAIETGSFMIINNNPNVTHSIKLFNNYLTRGTITAYSGHVSTGFVIGNISSSNIPSTIDGLTVANNVKIG